MRNKSVRRCGLVALHDTIKNGRITQKPSDDVPTEPNNIKCVKTEEIRDEPTNQDEVMNTRSV